MKYIGCLQHRDRPCPTTAPPLHDEITDILYRLWRRTMLLLVLLQLNTFPLHTVDTPPITLHSKLNIKTFSKQTGPAKFNREGVSDSANTMLQQ